MYIKNITQKFKTWISQNIKDTDKSMATVERYLQLSVTYNAESAVSSYRYVKLFILY